MNKKICFVAQFPPPIHGLSKAVDTLYHSYIAELYEFENIDISNNRKFIGNIIKMCKSNADIFYFTISQSKWGNIRDLIILHMIRKKKKKCIIHLHGGYYRNLIENDISQFQKKMNYNALKNVEMGIVLGPSLQWMFSDIISCEKIRVVPNCVDDAYLLHEKEFNEKINRIKDEHVMHVLFLSNFIREKGYLKVLEIANEEMKRVRLGGKQLFHFDFAGKFFAEEDQQEFDKYIDDNDLKKYVTYHGVVNGDDKRDLLENCEYFILLTNYNKEGQPISILEAMGSGMYIITTKHAGIGDIVHNNDNGIVVDPDDIDVGLLYNAMLKISYEERTNVMKKNREDILTKYTEKIYLANMKEIFDGVL